ncbi:c-type cytochrome [Rubritalea profundi]|uniref:Cytochrome c domain-containing protein n=1 Tax=Rubritalea profundi TaxID=1658618 RepID=A0A2S7U586_9BACT|nr:c-type cytochrome [Rubritalea profundi]PQJ29564.1 hypothetical protein BSZ32_14400 [Rubritalea profundi]
MKSHTLLISLGLGFLILTVLGFFFQWQEIPTTRQGLGTLQTKNVFQTTCATCHGEKGEGIQELMTPSIASLPRWYLEEQIQKFRNGQRGNHPKDLNGQKMRAAISALSADEINEALDYIKILPVLSHASTLLGDAERGYQLYYDNCMACHRFNGHGEVASSEAHHSMVCKTGICLSSSRNLKKVSVAIIPMMIAALR